MQYKQTIGKLNDCKQEVAMLEAALDTISRAALDLGADVKEYSSHNLDLQQGLLSSLKKQEAYEVQIRELERRRHKWMQFGAFGGYDPILQRWTVGGGVMVSLFGI